MTRQSKRVVVDDSRLVDELLKRLGGSIQGQLTAGDRIIEVKLVMRRRADIADVPGYQAEALAQYEKRPFRSCECPTARKHRFTSYSSTCSKPIACAVLAYSYNRQRLFYFTCSTPSHRDRFGAEGIVIPLPAQRLSEIRKAAERAADRRRYAEDARERAEDLAPANWLIATWLEGAPGNELGQRRREMEARS